VSEKISRYAMIGALVALILALGGMGYTYVALTGLASDVNSMKADIDTLVGLTAPEGLELLRAAKKEGMLTVYHVMSADYMARFMMEFSLKYPWMKVEYIRGGTYPMTEKVTAEMSAGKLQCDVFSVNDVNVFADFKKKGWLMKYDSPQYEKYPGYPASDPGYWFAVRAFTYPLVYNTKYVKTPPTSWKDMLKPEYKGKVIIVDPRVAGDALDFYWAMRKLYGIEFWETMGKQQVSIEYQGTARIEKLSTGEAWIGQHADFQYLDFKAKGAPVQGIWPAEGTCFTPNPQGILAKAPHPNCAKLFMEWCMSDEGQSFVVQQMTTISVKKGMPSPAGLPSGIKFIEIDRDDLAANRDTLLKEFEKLMGL